MHPKKLALRDLSLGPIVHDALPPELIERITAYKTILADADPRTLDDAIDQFKRDLHPEREVAIWERIADIFQTFTARYGMTDELTRIDVLRTLLAISVSADDFSAVRTLRQQQISELRHNFYFARR